MGESDVEETFFININEKEETLLSDKEKGYEELDWSVWEIGRLHLYPPGWTGSPPGVCLNYDAFLAYPPPANYEII